MKYIGIFRTDTHIRMAVLSDDQSAVQESEYPVLGKNEDISLLISSVLKESGEENMKISLALPRHEAYVRFLTLPSSESREVKTMAGYDLANLFPVNPEQLNYDTGILKAEENGYSRVMLAAADREKLIKAVEPFLTASCMPNHFSLSTSALCSDIISDDKGPLLSVHCEDSYLELNLFKDKVCHFSRGLVLENNSPEQALAEVKKTLVSVFIQGTGYPGIIISGRGIDLDSWKTCFEQGLERKVETNSDISVASGLARSACKGSKLLDLLPDQYTRQKLDQQKKRNIMITAGLALVNLVLLTNIFTVKIRQRQAFIPVLASEIKQIEKPAMMLRDKMRKARLSDKYYYSGRYALGIMSEIYRLAPEDIIITSADISGKPFSGTVLITGKAETTDDISTFSLRLNRSELFKPDVKSEYSKPNGPGGEQAEFTIKAEF